MDEQFGSRQLHAETPGNRIQRGQPRGIGERHTRGLVAGRESELHVLRVALDGLNGMTVDLAGQELVRGGQPHPPVQRGFVLQRKLRRHQQPTVHHNTRLELRLADHGLGGGNRGGHSA